MKKYWVPLGQRTHSLGYDRVHHQRTNLLEHRHALVLLDVTRWYSMHHDFKADVFDTWLEARPTYIWDLNKVAFLIIAIVPSAVKRDGHASIMTRFKSGTGYHNISVYTGAVAVAVNQGKVERSFIEGTLQRQNASF